MVLVVPEMNHMSSWVTSKPSVSLAKRIQQSKLVRMWVMMRRFATIRCFVAGVSKSRIAPVSPFQLNLYPAPAERRPSKLQERVRQHST